MRYRYGGHTGKMAFPSWLEATSSQQLGWKGPSPPRTLSLWSGPAGWSGPMAPAGQPWRACLKSKGTLRGEEEQRPAKHTCGAAGEGLLPARTHPAVLTSGPQTSTPTPQRAQGATLHRHNLVGTESEGRGGATSQHVHNRPSDRFKSRERESRLET